MTAPPLVQPRTAAGRALLDQYRAVVVKRPDVDGLLTASAILTIEAEARLQVMRCIIQDCEHGDSSMCVEALGPHVYEANESGVCTTCGQR